MIQVCKKLYRDENGDPIILTATQADIFALIFQKMHNRNHIMTYTQFGKSFCVALAILTRVATFPEKWCIVAGRKEQAKIIMSYIIQHCFDNPYTKSKLMVTKDESIESLKRERSKNRLSFRHADGLMGEVFVLSADGRNKQTAGDSVMGFGAPNVVLDEAALIDDDIEAKIFRMLGAQPNNFYFKIGNPFRRNHFYKDFVNERYHKINVDWKKGVQEGRTTFDFIDEARAKPLFEILYDNKFPDADVMDPKGWMPLIAEKEMTNVETGFTGGLMLGVDAAGEGTDEAKWVVRSNMKMEVVATEKISTPKSGAEKTITLMKHFGIDESNVNVDSFGEGAKWIAELAKSDVAVNAYNVGDKCEFDDDKEKYFNLRAYGYWMMREWIKQGGQMVKNANWPELLKIRYRANSSRQIVIEPKIELINSGMKSPNTADAAMLTFMQGKDINANNYEQDFNMEYDEWGSPSIVVDNNPLGL